MGVAVSLILIVEDESLVAMEMECRVTDLGYAVLGPASTVAQAHALLDRTTPDAVLLDMNLRGETAASVAHRLDRAGIPFALVTGYARLPFRDPPLAAAPKLSKPITHSVLANMLRMLTAAQTS